MEVFPCPLGILALRLCRSMAASKSFGHLGGDFGQLADERINLFAPFAVPAETEPDDRWKRPQISFERLGKLIFLAATSYMIENQKEKPQENPPPPPSVGLTAQKN